MDVKRHLSLCLFGMSMSLQAQANDSAITNNQTGSLFELSLDQLLDVRVVTAASGFEQNLDDAPATVSVIDQSEWRARGDRTLFEALQHLPGVHVSYVQTGLTSNKAIIRGLSGTFGEQILILVDGMAFRTIREGGSFSGQRIPLNAFKRIEVIRSPGSAVYGADAVGGIINLVSFEPGTAPKRATARVGDFDTAEAELNYQWQTENHSLQVALSGQTSAGDDGRVVESDLQTLLDQQFGTNASNAPGSMNTDYDIYSLNLQWKTGPLSVSYLDWNNVSSGDLAGVNQALDPEGEGNVRSQLLDLNYVLPVNMPGEMVFNASWRRVYSKLDSKVFPAGSVVPIGSDGNINFMDPDRLVLFTDGVIGRPGNDDRAVALQLNHVFEPWQGHTVRWAFGFEGIETHATEQKNFGNGVLSGETVVDGTLTDVTGTPYIYLPDRTRQNRYISLQDQWQINERWVGTLGVRYDDYSDVGDTVNPRMGLVWHTNRKLTFKTFAGTAFRAPSFIDLYAQNNPAGMGNPELEPEEVETIDTGLTTSYVFDEAWQMNLHLFRYHAKNVIAFVPQSGVQVAQNSGRLKVRGAEYELSWRSGEHMSLDFNYSYLDNYSIQNIDNSSVPKQMANLLANYKRGNINFYVGLKWVADRERTDGDARPEIDDYLIVDTRVHYLNGHWEWGAGVKNLLDEDAREPSNGFIENDYPTPGRQWLLDMTYYFER